MDYQQPPQGFDPNQPQQQGYDPNQPPPQQAYDPNMYQQPQYQAPPPGYGGYPPPPPSGGDYPGKGKGLAALILGISSCALSLFLGWWLPFVALIPLILGIVGLILSIQARKLVPPGVSGMATAGLVLCIIGLCWSAIEFAICGICVGCSMCSTCGSLGALGSLL